MFDADGVGFVFTPLDPYAGIDMDDCIGQQGALDGEAYRIIRALNGYVEYSPSGNGLHVIVRARVGRGRSTRRTPWGGELALYDHARFFTMVGNGRGTIREAQAALAWVVATFFPSLRSDAPMRRCAPVCGEDAEIVAKLLADASTAALWRGDASGYGEDHSAADLALCSHLAYFTGNDPDRMDAIFRRSGLMRQKWDEARGETTYGRLTISKTIER